METQTETYKGINRNKRISGAVEALGDVHLGKRFNTNVPLHRRGEREKMVWADFEASLMGATCEYHVQVGDLFDAFVVPIEVVMHAADIYIAASMANPQVQYAVYAGNHDLSRDVNRKSSFELFQRLMRHRPNITVITHRLRHNSVGFLPWDPFISAAEMATSFVNEYSEGFDIIFGHWDCKSFGGDDHNLIPLEQLAGKTKLVVTGHEHNAREFDYGDIHVVVVGSMQPYSHAEDPNGEFYVTMSLGEFEAARDGNELANRNVRVVLQDGELAPSLDSDALSTTFKKETTDEVVKEVDFDPSFDLPTLLGDALKEAGVEPVWISRMQEKFGEMRAEV